MRTGSQDRDRAEPRAPPVTLRFALLGDPVEHSISPAVHRAAFEAWGLDAEYEARRVSAEEVGAAMRESGLRGGNVTIPHKLHAAGLLDAMSRDVRATGACNSWRRQEDGSLSGDNTDVGGLRAALEELGLGIQGGRVLILGAGGAARAAVRALGLGGAGSIEILNRTTARARQLAREMPQASVRVVTAGALRGRYDLVLNATRLGLDPSDALPLELGDLDVAAVYDMVYAAGGTRWVRHAKRHEIDAHDGLRLLVHQAALSLRLWIPDSEPPIGAMWQAAERALEAAPS